MTGRIKTPEQLEQQVSNWNAAYPVGTRVYFDSVRRRQGEFKTATPAEILGGHTAVVWLEGYTGCVALDALEPVAKAEAQS
jgi:hypothetical protein